VDRSRAGLAGRPCLPPTPRGIIEDCCGLLDTLARPIARLEGEIAALAKPDPRVQALMALPGVGKLTAMTLVAEIGDISRRLLARSFHILSQLEEASAPEKATTRRARVSA
jgi:transposase